MRLPRFLSRTRKDPEPSTPPAQDNLGYNRFLWDWYSDQWDDPDFRAAWWAQLDLDEESLTLLGDEWATGEVIDRIVAGFIDPYIDPSSVVGEIGPGGGRVAIRVAPKVGEFWCFDISANMLARTARALRDLDHVRLHKLEDLSFPAELSSRFDFLYAFDVYVHFDLHSLWRHLQEIERMLKPGGRAFIHTANLRAPDGWTRFASQDRYTVEGHHFVTPDVVHALLEHTALRIIQESEPDASNMYLNRDYLVALERSR